MKTLHSLIAGSRLGAINPARRLAFPLLLLGAGLVFVQPCPGAPFVFQPTGSLILGRLQHTATLLQNGKVLVAGGFNRTNSNTLASAELYDPATGTWTNTGRLAPGRYGHTATLLPNGMVLVAGGNDRSGFATASAELYNPATGAWTATGSLIHDRESHTATLLPNGMVLVAGGVGNGIFPASAELYDSASGTWTETGSLVKPREFHTATLLPNGMVLVAGGINVTGVAIRNAELYDPASGTWRATGSLAIYRADHTATLLPNGKVLVAGGISKGPINASAELYDSASGTWTTTGSLVTARDSHTATLLPTGKVLVAGGRGTNGVLASAELYDPATGLGRPRAASITPARNTRRRCWKAAKCSSPQGGIPVSRLPRARNSARRAETGLAFPGQHRAGWVDMSSYFTTGSLGGRRIIQILSAFKDRFLGSNSHKMETRSPDQSSRREGYFEDLEQFFYRHPVAHVLYTFCFFLYILVLISVFIALWSDLPRPSHSREIIGTAGYAAFMTLFLFVYQRRRARRSAGAPE